MLTLTSTLLLGGGVEGGEEVGGWSAGLGTVNAGQLSILQLTDILICNGGVQLLDTGLKGEERDLGDRQTDCRLTGKLVCNIDRQADYGRQTSRQNDGQT